MSTQDLPYYWGLIILMFIVFFPIGIYMVIVNAEHEEKILKAKKQQQFNEQTQTSANANSSNPPIPPIHNPTVTMPKRGPSAMGAVVGSADVIECSGCGYRAQVIVGYASNCDYCGCSMISRPCPEAMAELHRQQIELEKQKATTDKQRRTGVGLEKSLDNLGQRIEDFFDNLF
ncbi:MAG: hypothetical protein FWE13_05605 [Firmicutes bacterium]|nr:hypothetical protein [Bacillota bacterium]